MSEERREIRNLSAARTGVPVSYESEDRVQPESKLGMWLVVIAVAIAFAMVLQMETDRLHSKKTTSTPIRANLWAVN